MYPFKILNKAGCGDSAHGTDLANRSVGIQKEVLGVLDSGGHELFVEGHAVMLLQKSIQMAGADVKLGD